MHRLLSIVFFTFTLPALAQVSVELNADEVSVDAAEAVIVRTSRTPGKVKITMRVPKDKQVCERTDYRQVLRTSSIECGTDIIHRRVPGGSVCVRRNPQGECLRFQTTWRMDQVYVPRTCMVTESYCSQYGTVTVTDLETLTVQFKKAVTLAESETETFLVKADQKRYDGNAVSFTITAQETIGQYKIGRKKILGGLLGREDDSYIIQQK